MSSIPRRLIQTARTRELGPLARASAANLRLLHPAWDYAFFDDEDVARFVAKEFPEFTGVFESFRHRIQRYDFFRYLAVYRLGGFYFDLDVLLSEPLDELLASGCVFPFEELTVNTYLRRTIDWELGNYGFGAQPGDPFVGAIIANCVRAATDPAWAAPLLAGVPRWIRSDYFVLNTTGPGMVTRTYAESAAASRHVRVIAAGDGLDPRHWHQFGRFGVHLMQASWRGRHGWLRQRLGLRWEDARRRRFRAERLTGGSPLRPYAPASA